MTVYHGSAEIVQTPDVKHSYRSLDFGKGFYVTTVREQANRWARRKADILGVDKAFISIYEMTEDFDGFKVKIFPDDMAEWIDFVCMCRDNSEVYRQYDIIKGKVANDKIFRVVDMYRSGIWERERALKEIKAYPNYDQIAFINQQAIDSLLSFQEWNEV